MTGSPAVICDLLEESDILGIEAPLWTETILTMKDIEYMVFPRLPGIAELAWSAERPKLGGISPATRCTRQAHGSNGDQFLSSAGSGLGMKN